MALGSFSKVYFGATYRRVYRTVERVSVYKLLSVTVNSALKWDHHVAAIKSKAAKRLWFLKTLKHASVSVDDLIFYYQAVIRPLLPMLEYASVVWHSSLSKEQTYSHLKMLNVVRHKLLLEDFVRFYVQNIGNPVIE